MQFGCRRDRSGCEVHGNLNIFFPRELTAARFEAVIPYKIHEHLNLE